MQVGYLEVVDAMVAQLVRRLWEAECQGKGPFSICITGDHSTPVEFGDHSHEPVPIAMADIRSAPYPPEDMLSCRVAALLI